MNAAPTKAELIASLNDRFRSTLFPSDVPGIKVVTNGIIKLDGQTHFEIWKAIEGFADFTEDNDPYGEHDFGAFDHPKAGKVFWKIDYYANEKCECGSEHPEDPNRSFRVLTVMLADEY